jgi:hypothetical protein
MQCGDAIFENHVDMRLPTFSSKIDRRQICDMLALLSHGFVAAKTHNYAVLSHIEQVRHFLQALFMIQNWKYIIMPHI